MGDIRGKRVLRVAQKLGYKVKKPPGRKHYVILDESETGIVTVIPRGKIKSGTLSSIIKDLGISKSRFNKLK